MDQKYYIKIISLAMALMLSLSLYGCGKKSSSADLKSAPVAGTAQASEDSSNALSGKVKPSADVDIVSKIPGRIATVNCTEGQQVKVGDILFTIEDKDIRLQVSKAEAAVNAAKASYAKATGSTLEQQDNKNKNDYELAQTEYNAAVAARDVEKQKEITDSTVKNAEEKLKAAEDELNNNQKSFATGGVSKQELDKAINNLHYAQNQLKIESLNYSNNKIDFGVPNSSHFCAVMTLPNDFEIFFPPLSKNISYFI